MKQKALSAWAVTVCTAVSVALAGCAEPASPASGTQPTSASPVSRPAAAKDGGELVVGVPDRLPAFDPFGRSKREPALTPYESLAYRGLLAHEPDGRLTGALAATFRIDRSGPKPAVVLTLRAGAKWADGQPVTAEDAAFTLETYARPDYDGVWRKPANDVQGVSLFRSGKAAHLPGVTVDAQKGEIRIALDEDDRSFLEGLTAPLLPKHQLAGKPLAEIDRLSRTGGMVGAGPFQPQSLAETKWTFAANDAYYGGKPHIRSLSVVPVKADRLVEEAEAGRVDLMPLPPDAAKRLAAEAGTARIVSSAGRGFHFVGFNMESPVLRDAGVRRALAQAVSPEAVAQDVFFGYAAPARSPLAPGTFAYVPGGYPSYDPEAAKRTLAAKGYSAQNPLVLTLVYPADSAVRERLARTLADAWEALPVRLNMKRLEPDAFLSYLFGGSPLDLYLFAWTYPADPTRLREVWHSGSRVGETGLNASRYRNPRADQLLDQVRTMLPDDRTQALLAEWQRLVAADLPIVPLVEMRQPYYVSPRLKGPGGELGADPFAGIQDWSLDGGG